MSVEMTAPNGTATVTPMPAPPMVQPSRLLAVLTVGGALAGMLLVIAYGVTLPRIEANRARALDAAVKEVLKEPARYDTLYVANGALTKTLPPGADPKTAERVYLGYGADGRPVGFAVVAGEAGFQDVIMLIFGYDAKTRKLIAMKVLESKETPGLGDRIEKDAGFVGQFPGAEAPLTAVKPGKRAKASDVATITGATISSRAVIRIINRALDRLRPMLEAYRGDGTA